MMLFGHEDILKPASYYLEMHRCTVYMKHCRCWYIVFFWGPDFPSDLISPLANIRMKLMMDSGIPVISLSLAMVNTSNARVTRKVRRAAAIWISCAVIHLVTLGSILNLRSNLATSSCSASEKRYQTVLRGTFQGAAFGGYSSQLRIWTAMVIWLLAAATTGNAPGPLRFELCGHSIALFLMQASTLLRLTCCDGRTNETAGCKLRPFSELGGLCIDANRISLSPAC